MSFHLKNSSQTKNCSLGYTRGSRSSGNVTKEVKLVLLLRSPRWRKKRNVDDKRMLNNSHKQSMGRFESWTKSCPQSQRSPRSTYVCHHYRLQGHTKPNCQKLRAMNNASAPRSWGPDLRMIGEIGLVNRQEVEEVIPEWWTWWRWLGHSPTVWKASYEGLKVLTPVPNPIRISPQTQVMCGWKRVLMHKHYKCPCINTSYALWFCLVVCLLVMWFEIWLFVFAFFHTNCLQYCFWLIFLFLCVKNPKNHVKSRKSKVCLTLLNFVSKLVLLCIFVLMALCIYKRSLFLCTLITVEEILKSMWLL